MCVCFLAPEKGSQGRDTPVAVRTPSACNLVSRHQEKKKQDSPLGRIKTPWRNANLRVKADQVRANLDYLPVPESKEVFKKKKQNRWACQKDREASLRGLPPAESETT